MRTYTGSLVALVSCLFAGSVGTVAYGQTTRLNCNSIGGDCLISETPVPGVRIVRQRDYSKRPAYYLSSNLYTTLAASRETGNRFVAFDFVVPPGGGPLPHTHQNEWETFFVEEGHVTFTIGVEDTAPYNFMTTEVPAGSIIYGPQGPVHGFINTSKEPARIFSFAMPSGLDEFFRTSGEPVVNYNAPIPPISLEEIIRTAFWAQQRGDALYPPNSPAPAVAAGTPEHVLSSIHGAGRPQETGPFGEKRVVLLTPNEVGTITASEAFCGPPPIPGRQGGTVKYSYFSLPPQRNVPAPYISQNTEVLYTLDGTLTLFFTNPNDHSQRRVVVDPLTLIQIEPGVEFSIANLPDGPPRNEPVRSLAISVISPVCPPSPFFQP